MTRVRAELMHMGTEVDERVDPDDGQVLVLFMMAVEDARKLAFGAGGRPVALTLEPWPEKEPTLGLPVQLLAMVSEFARGHDIPFEPYAALCRMAKTVLELEDQGVEDPGYVWERAVLDFAERFGAEDWATDEVLNDVPELLRQLAIAHDGD